MSGDDFRTRLQLAVGSVAKLGEERRAPGGRRRFDATSPSGETGLRFDVHPLAPAGPAVAPLRERLDRLKALAHPSLMIPTAVGEFEGRTWTLEPPPAGPTVLDAVERRGILPQREALLALREVCRALAAMHRREMAHGAVDLETIELTPDGAKVTGLALRASALPREDLDALGPLAWALFAGNQRYQPGVRVSGLRRGIPAEIDALVTSLNSPDPMRRPQRAEAILEILDAFPDPHPSPLTALLDGAGRGARRYRTRAAVVFLLVLGLAVLVAILLTTH